MRSLRLRLLLLTLFVSGVALASVGVLSRVAVRSEYLRLERTERSVRLSGVAQELATEGGFAGSRAEVDARLERMAAPIGLRLLLLGSDGRVLGVSAPSLRTARFEASSGDRLSIEMQERVGGVLHSRRIVLVGAPHATVQAPDGAVLGTLYALPPIDDDKPGEEPRFVSTMNRWLLFAVLASAGLALALTLALSRRILGPVEALTAAARRMEAGDLNSRVAPASDDEIGELGRAFNAMADALERTEALRRTLVADVAHELRTPLTNLRCQIEALQDGLQAADPPTLRSIHQETLLLARLVNDLQDLALAESGQLRLQHGAVAIAEVVEAALDAVRHVANERTVALHADVEGECWVDGDHERLGQVLRNLLSNALTHTPEGGAVTVAARRVDGAPVALVAVDVRDTGPGIPPEHLPHVFDRFYRADPSRARASGGAGLGLAIVKQLVEAHGGWVTVASEPGQGASFTVTLPAFMASSRVLRIPS